MLPTAMVQARIDAANIAASAFGVALDGFIATQAVPMNIVGVTPDNVVYSATKRSDDVVLTDEYAPPIPFVTLPDLVSGGIPSAERLAHQQAILGELQQLPNSSVIKKDYLEIKTLVESLITMGRTGDRSTPPVSRFTLNGFFVQYAIYQSAIARGEVVPTSKLLNFSYEMYRFHTHLEVDSGQLAHYFYIEALTQISEQLYIQVNRQDPQKVSEFIKTNECDPRWMVTLCREQLARDLYHILKYRGLDNGSLLYKELALRAVFNSAFLTFGYYVPRHDLPFYDQLQAVITQDPKQRAEHLLRTCMTIVKTNNASVPLLPLLTEVEQRYTEAGVSFDREKMNDLLALATQYDATSINRVDLGGRGAFGTGASSGRTTFGGHDGDLG